MTPVSGEPFRSKSICRTRGSMPAPDITRDNQRAPRVFRDNYGFHFSFMPFSQLFMKAVFINHVKALFARAVAKESAVISGNRNDHPAFRARVDRAADCTR